MEIRRFGPGHRRPEGPPGTRGLTGQVIWDDERANIAELAFSRHGVIPPHDNPNTTLFIVVSGGGYVQVGDERIRINHGEAVVWPADVPHGAWTDGSEMRAIVVELTEGNAPAALIDGTAVRVATEDVPGWSTSPGSAAGDDPAAAPTAAVEAARGSLAERPPSRDTHDETEGEPW
jgi:quercetin dioxygenase-like cupin family protein